MLRQIAALVLLVSVGARNLKTGKFYLYRSNDPLPCLMNDCQWESSENYAMACNIEFKLNNKTETGIYYYKNKSTHLNPIVMADGEPAGETVSDEYFGAITRSVIRKANDPREIIECYAGEREFTELQKTEMDKLCNNADSQIVDQEHCD